MSALHTKLYIRADAVEKAAFERAARLSGMSLSVWVRFELRRAAAEALEKAGERADFLPPTRGPRVASGSKSRGAANGDE